jgi:hypothetical protein
MAATLILRTVKGTPLTNLEVDNNFSNISTYANTIDANIGLLASLTTTSTGNIVAAVNSIKSGNLSQFGSTTSAQLLGTISDETGTGNVVFNTGPTISLPLINNIKQGYTSTATAAGTTTLTSSSNYYQRFTGSTTQTVVLPVTSTLAEGVAYEIENASTGNLTVNSSGGNLVITVIPGVTVQCRCIGTTLTTAGDWDAEYNEFAGITGTGNVVLATTPTLVTPVIGLATGTSAMLTANIGAAAGNVSGNFTAGNFQSAGNVNTASALLTGTLTAPAITSTTTLTTKKIVETVVAIGNTGTSATIDLSAGTVFTATLNGNATLTITNAGTVSSFTLVLTNDGTGSRTVTFAYSGGTFRAPGGSVSRTTTANATDVWFFFTTNGGTNWNYAIPMANLS